MRSADSDMPENAQKGKACAALQQQQLCSFAQIWRFSG
jgi:hypothetical protein